MQTPDRDPASGAFWRHQRMVDQTRIDLRGSLALLVAYAGDALLLAGFCLAGVGQWSSPVTLALCGLLAEGAAALASRFTGRLPLSDLRRTLLPALFAVGLMLTLAWRDPALAGLLLFILVSVLTTVALYLPPRWLLAMALLVALGITWVAVALEGRLTLPVDGPVQQALTVLFLLWTLAKTASVHVAGTAMRMQLDASHARLADALEQVRQLAEVDVLTGLANRRRLMAALETERARCLREGGTFSLAMLDIDHFKRINDSHGHPLGDQVLATVAALLRAGLRAPDLVGRYGGEEFLLLLPGAATAGDAAQTAERLRQLIAGHAWEGVAAGLQVTVSVGVATSAPGEPVDRLLERADRGLYQAKHAGRNRVGCWPDGTLTR